MVSIIENESTTKLENENSELQTKTKNRKNVKKTKTKENAKLATHNKIVQKFGRLTFLHQQRLFENTSVPPSVLQHAGEYLTARDYSEVVIERNSQDLCGYPLCPQSLNKNNTNTNNTNTNTNTGGGGGGQDIIICPSRRVIRSAAKVRQYCSDQCLVKSAYFSKQLGSEALHLKFSTGTFQSKQKLEVLPLDLNLNSILKDGKFENNTTNSSTNNKSATNTTLTTSTTTSTTTTTTSTTSTSTSTGTTTSTIDKNNNNNNNKIESTTMLQNHRSRLKSRFQLRIPDNVWQYATDSQNGIQIVETPPKTNTTTATTTTIGGVEDELVQKLQKSLDLNTEKSDTSTVKTTKLESNSNPNPDPDPNPDLDLGIDSDPDLDLDLDLESNSDLNTDKSMDGGIESDVDTDTDTDKDMGMGMGMGMGMDTKKPQLSTFAQIWLLLDKMVTPKTNKLFKLIQSTNLETVDEKKFDQMLETLLVRVPDDYYILSKPNLKPLNTNDDKEKNEQQQENQQEGDGEEEEEEELDWFYERQERNAQYIDILSNNINKLLVRFCNMYGMVLAQNTRHVIHMILCTLSFPPPPSSSSSSSLTKKNSSFGSSSSSSSGSGSSGNVLDLNNPSFVLTFTLSLLLAISEYLSHYTCIYHSTSPSPSTSTSSSSSSSSSSSKLLVADKQFYTSLFSKFSKNPSSHSSSYSSSHSHTQLFSDLTFDHLLLFSRKFIEPF